MNTDKAPHQPSPMLDSLKISTVIELQEQLKIMDDAFNRVEEGFRFVQKIYQCKDPVINDAVDQLDSLEKNFRRLKRSFRIVIVEDMRRQRDQEDLKKLSITPEVKEDARKRLAQADLNLSALYRHLQTLCHRSAESVIQEAQSKLSKEEFPLWDAEVRAKLDYRVEESHPLYDEQSNNVLATQDAINWFIDEQGMDANVMADDPASDNWLDCKSEWLTRQGWLTHDVLEHNYGHHPRFGIAALLNTDTVCVEVHTVRSYVYDLYRGQFVAPEGKTNTKQDE